MPGWNEFPKAKQLVRELFHTTATHHKPIIIHRNREFLVRNLYQQICLSIIHNFFLNQLETEG